ncbi:hypothetical protein N9N97_02830 [Rickettsiaceae bacterium]|nr:hypothetical protein [Rickettsiaceae bacterium]
MEIGPEEAAKLRDELHNLDIHHPEGRELYYQKLYYIIASGERFSGKIYRDSKNLLTIGYGFNMNRGRASIHEWNNIFKGSTSFEEAKNGDIEITREQGQMLKQYGVSIREKELADIYNPYWDRMRANERAILTDLYYQSPKLAKKGTKFCKYLKEYYKTGDVHYFELAVTEVKLHSSYSKNPIERIGLQNRNNIRAIILDSRESILYSNPHDELIPKEKRLKVILEETIIPKYISNSFPKSTNLGDYYIWRTREDAKVRSAHKELEGRVFKHEYKMMHPTDDYGCRCYAERLPIHAEIVEQRNQLNRQDYSPDIVDCHDPA